MVLDVKSITQNKGLKAGKMKGKTNIINKNASVGGFSNSGLKPLQLITVLQCRHRIQLLKRFDYGNVDFITNFKPYGVHLFYLLYCYSEYCYGKCLLNELF